MTDGSMESHILPVTGEYGIVIRLQALREHCISRQQLTICMEGQLPIAETDALLSYGPHFGGEALNRLALRLQQLGLVYWDDFFDIQLDTPGWVTLFLAYRKPDSAP